LLGGVVYVLKKRSHQMHIILLVLIENTKGHIGNCQCSFARALGVLAGLILAICLIRCPTIWCGSDRRV
jgi:hypothetical protein